MARTVLLKKEGLKWYVQTTEIICGFSPCEETEFKTKKAALEFSGKYLKDQP